MALLRLLGCKRLTISYIAGGLTEQDDMQNAFFKGRVLGEWKVTVYTNIGNKHDFLCINICRAPREMLKLEPERRGFPSLLRGPVDVNVSEKHV